MKCMDSQCFNEAKFILFSKIHNHSKSMYGCLCKDHGEQELARFKELGRDAELLSLK